MMDRSDEHQGTQGIGDANERLAVVAKLRPDSRELARAILAEGAPYDLGEPRTR